MLYRAIKYQVDKGPVDAVTGKAKRTLNDSHLLREDVDYCAVVSVTSRLAGVMGLTSVSVSPVAPVSPVSDSDCPGEERSGSSALSRQSAGH